MHSADQPIKFPSEDQLDRYGFCRAIGNIIDQLAVSKDGFVMAIHGPWGSGKSSAVNLILHYLTLLQMARASEQSVFWGDSGERLSLEKLDELENLYRRVEEIVLRCNVENLTYVPRDGLMRSFSQILQSDFDATLAYRFFRLNQFVKSNPKIIVMNYSPWLISGRGELAYGLLSDLQRAIGDKLGEEVEASLKAYAERFIELASILSPGIDAASGTPVGSIISSGLSIFQKRLSQQTQTLVELKQILANALRRIPDRKVLITVDDLDRLSPNEAADVVSIVKGLGDLPNVTYLLTYDSKRLGHLLEIALKTDGDRYLEKIVQYSRSLPLQNESDLLSIFVRSLAEISEKELQNHRSRVTDAWNFAMKHYLSTLRTIRRLLNSFTASYGGIGNQTDFVDLLVLETLGIHEPEIYSLIRSNLLRFTQEQSGTESSTLRSLVQDALEKANHQAAAKAALDLLFPQSFSVPDTPPPYFAEIIANQRIRLPQFASNYFRIDPASGTWSKLAFEKLILANNPSAVFDELLHRIELTHAKGKRQLCDSFLAFFEHGFAKQLLRFDLEWLRSVVNASPKLLALEDEARSVFANDSILKRLNQIAINGLEGLDERERTSILLESFFEATDITLLCQVTRTLYEKETIKETSEVIRIGLRPTIRLLAAKDAIWSQAIPGIILLFWPDAGESGETNAIQQIDVVTEVQEPTSDVRNFTDAQFQTMAGTLNLMKTVLSLLAGRSGSGEVIVLQRLSDIIDLKRLTASAKEIESSPDQDAVSLANRFLRRTKRAPS